MTMNFINGNHSDFHFDRPNLANIESMTANDHLQLPLMNGFDEGPKLSNDRIDDGGPIRQTNSKDSATSSIDIATLSETLAQNDLTPLDGKHLDGHDYSNFGSNYIHPYVPFPTNNYTLNYVTTNDSLNFFSNNLSTVHHNELDHTNQDASITSLQEFTNKLLRINYEDICNNIAKYSKSRPLHNLRKPRSAYILFLECSKATFFQHFPKSSFNQYQKYAGTVWKNLTPEQKQPYYQLEKNERRCFSRDMQSIQSNLGINNGVTVDEEALTEEFLMADEPREKRTPKTAFSLFVHAMRPQVERYFPGMNYNQIQKQLSKDWQAMTKDEKQIWVNLEQESKRNFPESNKKRKVINKKAFVLPRAPRSAYTLFYQAARKQLSEERPELSFREFPTVCSKLWRDMPADQRALWQEDARLDNERYDKELMSFIEARGQSNDQEDQKPSGTTPDGLNATPTPVGPLLKKARLLRKAVEKKTKNPNRPQDNIENTDFPESMTSMIDDHDHDLNHYGVEYEGALQQLALHHHHGSDDNHLYMDSHDLKLLDVNDTTSLLNHSHLHRDSFSESFAHTFGHLEEVAFFEHCNGDSNLTFPDVTDNFTTH